MREWIAGAMAVLGTLLVLTGATVIVLRMLGLLGPDGLANRGNQPAPGTVGPDEPTTSFTLGIPAPAPAPAGSRFGQLLQSANGADRLIGWGIVLLLLAAVAGGAISFNFGVDAGTR